MRNLFLLATLFISAITLADNAQDARQTIQGFAQDLKQTLASTMKANGPIAAIKVCNLSAPAITSQHSQTPWHISRTSLKVRNPDNQANEWLTQILLDFEQRKLNGEPVAQIEFSTQKEDGWYFVKAIPTGEPCLACHGRNLNPAVQAKLAELYPHDQRLVLT